MQIHLAGIKFEPQVFEHNATAEEYLIDQEYATGSLDIKATVSREGNSLRLDLATELDGQFICDRCGDAFARGNKSEAEFYFTFTEDKSAVPDHENAIIPAKVISLDISQEIRDAVILGLPSKILCSETCKGLCAQCGANLNTDHCQCRSEEIDPRWEKLKEISKK